MHPVKKKMPSKHQYHGNFTDSAMMQGEKATQTIVFYPINLKRKTSLYFARTLLFFLTILASIKGETPKLNNYMFTR